MALLNYRFTRLHCLMVLLEEVRGFISSCGTLQVKRGEIEIYLNLIEKY